VGAHWFVDLIVEADLVSTVSTLTSWSRCRQPRRLPLWSRSSLQRMALLFVAGRLLNSVDSSERHVTAPRNVNKRTGTFTSSSAAPTRISRLDQARIHDLLFSSITRRRRSLSPSGSSAPRTSWERRMNLIMSKSSLAASLLGPSTLPWTGHLEILSEI
jgi:hypothetical protein